MSGTIRLVLHGKPYDLRLVVGTYPGTGATSVQLVDVTDDELFCTLSVNLESTPVPTGYHFWLKEWSENTDIARAMEFHGYIDSIDVPAIKSGYVSVYTYTLTPLATVTLLDSEELAARWAIAAYIDAPCVASFSLGPIAQIADSMSGHPSDWNLVAEYPTEQEARAAFAEMAEPCPSCHCHVTKEDVVEGMCSNCRFYAEKEKALSPSVVQ